MLAGRVILGLLLPPRTHFSILLYLIVGTVHFRGKDSISTSSYQIFCSAHNSLLFYFGGLYNLIYVCLHRCVSNLKHLIKKYDIRLTSFSKLK
jgi:hypothetical protein